ncbi:hypothetical protein OG298_29740 [Streptomyces sp. NBC_01005]|uniref:hypothetical protein n=1 Tax=Streptomyces sp. NBC_01005 TaxID=2903715 RepID=UPI003870C9D7|nr:hypothetical protein OG298_29740 [Streptomyces sp. NBC_01005]
MRAHRAVPPHWAGDSAVLVRYIKGRTPEESITLPSKAVRLLERWLEYAELARSHCPPQLRNGLWLWLAYTSRRAGDEGLGPWRYGRPCKSTIVDWSRDAGVVDAHGAPVVMHRHRIRTTFESHRDRSSWISSRRSTIDPNHTPGVEGDHYLSAMTEAQQNALEDIVEQAQGDLLRRGQPPMVLSDEQVADLARQFPQLVSELELDDRAIAELVGGQRDVFVASCADPTAGVHGPKGKPCPARPWVCLLCPLALFTPRHAANLLRMKAFFARQWQQMPATQFMAAFGHYAQRIEDVLIKYDPTQLAAAATQVTDTDAEIPLERLKIKVAELKERLAQRDETVAELTAFKELGVSRLAAQHDEIVRLREQVATLGNVRRLPAARPGTAPYGSCS